MTKYALLLLAIAGAACGDDDGGGTPAGDAGPPPRPDAGMLDPLREDCEPLVPEVCAYPFPSDYFLRDGRIMFGPTTLPRTATPPPHHLPADILADRDGFSVNAALLAFFPDATQDGIPRPDSIASSLEPGSATVLIEAETGTRVAHFSEIDMATRNYRGRSFMIRPVAPLRHSTRYIAAIRNVVDSTGYEVQPSEVFQALRDGTDHDHPYVTARRAHFESEIFAPLEAAGVERADLQLAWDFTTSSQENDVGSLLHVRDDALAAIGMDGPEYVIDNVENDVDENIAKRIEGRMTVPMYLTSADPGSFLNRGPDGRGAQNGTMEVPFLVIVPRSASMAMPAPPVQIGHGLLGSRRQAGGYASFANTYNYVLFAVDWLGMSEVDVEPITLALSTGAIEDFDMIPDRLHQGMVNFLASMRMMRGRFARDPEVAGLIDTSRGFYAGASQGGIFGATYMAITTDVERGMLGVPGQPYNLLLQRSVDFDPYQALLRISFRDGPDIQLVLNLIQGLWDRAEPGSFSRHIQNDLFPGTPAHRVLMMVAIGDHQVSTLGAHVMARAIDVPNLIPANRSIWGVEDAMGPIDGSAMIEYSFGLPPEPLDNVPMEEGDDPHGSIRPLPTAQRTIHEFFQTGVVNHHCEGPCDPE